MFFRLSGNVSRCDVDFVKCKQKVFSLSRKVLFIWDRNYLVHRDLACQQARSQAMQLFILFHNRGDLACKLAEMFAP